MHGRPSAQQLRIIGGQWRGRRLTFPAIPGLRPTPDRVRETLFNWLAPTLSGARCLDLFAGSGALGLEALSRGAAEVVFVECDRKAVHSLRDHLLKLNAASMAQVYQAEVLTWLVQHGGRLPPFDIVFLDPPFGQNRLSLACESLAQHGWLKVDSAQIYLESEAEWTPQLPSDWMICREKRAGAVAYRLARCSTAI